MNVDDLLGALRAQDGDDPELAEATRLRVHRSLETRVRTRHQWVGFATAAGILFGGTVSWALATGKVGALWSPAPPALTAPAPPPPDLAPNASPIDSPAPSTAPAAVPSAASPPIEAVAAPSAAAPPPAPAARIASLPGPALPPETAPPVARPRGARPPSMPVAAPAPVEVLYRRAHELHFHGGDPATTLAAWDAYLAAEPAGRFSVDARYNRAILLVRLHRYAEARAALLPFAHGEVEPAGYRRPEAEQLVERLAHTR